MRAYGCVKCQEWHYEGDAEYKPHIYWQSKHGIEERPVPEHEKIFRAVMADRPSTGSET